MVTIDESGALARDGRPDAGHLGAFETLLDDSERPANRARDARSGCTGRVNNTRTGANPSS
jgi:hypothetical protein